ncbi:MAG: heparan-alpha-glucosaminide N-acetyltransferase domain-containing protein [Legionellales bacterium]|jgi:uncharacterized membrane protein
MNQRITAIDSLRGMIILLMILGHARYAFLPLAYDPIELGSGSTALYLMRVVTNLCAPIFFLLSGMGIFLLVRNYNNITLASKDLLKRGLIIIGIELFYISWLWFWPSEQYTFAFTVLWTLGIGMIILSALIHLPIKWAAMLAIIVLLGHNALDNFFSFAFDGSFFSFILMLLHGERTHVPLGVVDVFFAYAIIPWFAVMLFGYVLGSLVFAANITAAQRQKMLLILGFGLLGSFILLRMVVGYGDSIIWTWQSDNIAYSLLSIFKTTKYPPSLQYLCLALSVACLLLALLDKKDPFSKYLCVFGQVPLFIYIIHIPLVEASAWLVHFIMFGEKLGPTNQQAFALPWLYLIWLSFLPLLYFAGKWYRPVKMKYKHSYLKYI